ncbi:NAD(P)H-hydrate dehydratase [Paracoccaceae bacterium GXU_MW_L88]
MQTKTILTAEEMRAAEQAVIDAGTPGYQLMLRAGQAVVDSLAGRPETAMVLCGPGNNGGDGFVIGQLLRARGVKVRLHAVSPETLPPDAAQARDAFLKAKGEILPYENFEPAELLIDALFGIGLNRDCDEVLAPVMDHGCTYVIAVDLPSGLDTNSGRKLGQHALKADLTVTFHAPKPAHFFNDGPRYVGQIKTVDIGIPDRASGAQMITRPTVDPAKRHGHKFDYGHAVMVSGPWHSGGAIRLAAASALRVGAGLVTIAADEAAAQIHAAHLDAVMVKPCDAPAFAALVEDRRVSAIGLGPALGTDENAEAALTVAVESGKPLVLDADALTLLANTPRDLPQDVIMTPHEGEFARLVPHLAERLATENRIDLLRDAAAEYGATIVLKGPATVIASPDGRASVYAALYERAVPWLATAGAGDVLTGIITGLLARGFDPFDAAATGVLLHAEAGRKRGAGLIAEDLPRLLPSILVKWTGQRPD